MKTKYYTIPCVFTPSIIQVFPIDSSEPSGAYEEKELGVYTVSNFAAKTSTKTTDLNTAILYALQRPAKQIKVKAPVHNPIQQSLF